MSENIMDLVLQAEKEYHSTVKKAVNEAGTYADDHKKKQGEYISGLEREWYAYEKKETEAYEKDLREAEQRMNTEMEQLKERLRICQAKKAAAVSDRLAEEVLSLNDS